MLMFRLNKQGLNGSQAYEYFVLRAQKIALSHGYEIVNWGGDIQQLWQQIKPKNSGAQLSLGCRFIFTRPILMIGSLLISTPTTPGLDQLLQAGHFQFNKNRLSGKIPYKLFSSEMKLIHILFDGNQLTGEIPSMLGLVQTLEVLFCQ